VLEIRDSYERRQVAERWSSFRDRHLFSVHPLNVPEKAEHGGASFEPSQRGRQTKQAD
jgi:hypothetical protein